MSGYILSWLWMRAVSRISCRPLAETMREIAKCVLWIHVFSCGASGQRYQYAYKNEALAEGGDIALEAFTYEEGVEKCNQNPSCCGAFHCDGQLECCG
jgi:hypothetical protein